MFSINLQDARDNFCGHEIDPDVLINMPVHEYEALSKEDRLVCNMSLRYHCRLLKKKYKPVITPIQHMISLGGPLSRRFDLNLSNIPGVANIPDDGCILLPNHSNSHDAFTIAEILKKSGYVISDDSGLVLPNDSNSYDSFDVEGTIEKKGHPSTFLAAEEGLSPLEKLAFKGAHATMINRKDKESCNYGLIDFAGKVANNDTGIIFGECTWNMHPRDLMLPIKTGPVKAAAITGKPIIPTIMEYIEVPGMVLKEEDLYQECAVAFGTPIYIDPSGSIIEQTAMVQKKMEELRRAVRAWKSVDNIADIDPEIYVNHTWLKKFGTGVIEYDSEQEIQLVRGKDGKAPENEYHLDENGNFVPGPVQKDYYGYVKKKKLFGSVNILE